MGNGDLAASQNLHLFTCDSLGGSIDKQFCVMLNYFGLLFQAVIVLIK